MAYVGVTLYRYDLCRNNNALYSYGLYYYGLYSAMTLLTMAAGHAARYKPCSKPQAAL